MGAGGMGAGAGDLGAGLGVGGAGLSTGGGVGAGWSTAADQAVQPVAATAAASTMVAIMRTGRMATPPVEPRPCGSLVPAWPGPVTAGRRRSVTATSKWPRPGRDRRSEQHRCAGPDIIERPGGGGSTSPAARSLHANALVMRTEAAPMAGLLGSPPLRGRRRSRLDGGAAGVCGFGRELPGCPLDSLVVAWCGVGPAWYGI